VNKSSQGYRASLVIFDYTVLPVIRHKWTHPVSTNPSQTGWHSINLALKADVTLMAWVRTGMVNLSADSHPSK